jgi:hypothetical protein
LWKAIPLFTDRPDRARFAGFLAHVVNRQIFATTIVEESRHLKAAA